MDTKVIIENKNIKLEGILNKNTSSDAVLISHPHPLYGGNMDNPVVMTIAEAFFEKGFTTLRFNFRGTCNSTGKFDDGQGEQEDIRNALLFLRQHDYEKIYLVGYSFGARINASVVSKGCNIEDHIMVSPPVAFMSFDDVDTMPLTGLVITGDNDDIAPKDLIKKHIDRWKIHPTYKIIDHCDHFYSGGLAKLNAILTNYISGQEIAKHLSV